MTLPTYRCVSILQQGQILSLLLFLHSTKKKQSLTRVNIYSLPFCFSIMTASTKSPDENTLSQSIDHGILIWLDSQFDQRIRMEFDRLFQRIHIFETNDQCLTFLNGIGNERIFLVATGRLGQEIVPKIHDRTQIDSIYIFCMDKAKHEQWAKNWTKIHGIFTNSTPLYQALNQTIRHSESNTISITFLLHNNIDQSKISFMYTQILKDILLSNEYHTSNMRDLIEYCRKSFDGNKTEMSAIEDFKRTYRKSQAIWWYTRECFLYRMLNRALRLMDFDEIMKMDFFIRDLHQQLVSLHSKQMKKSSWKDPFRVYRGQDLSRNDLTQISQAKGGLLSFNNFLSTSTDESIGLFFARRSRNNPHTIGVLFVMTIDSSSSSIPFALIRDHSNLQVENEILFSMHAIFRIESIQLIENETEEYWRMELIQTTENDHELHHLTDCLRNEIQGYTPWDRLGRLLIQLGQLNNAEKVYEGMLKTKLDHHAKANVYNQLGWLTDAQGDYEQSISFYEKSLRITEKHFHGEKANLAFIYNNISVAYSRMNDYTKSLSFSHKALETALMFYNPNHIQLASIYNNLGLTYLKVNDLSNAQLYLHKAFEIRKKNHPTNHPDLAESYHNLGLLSQMMNNLSQASEYYHEAYLIRQQILPFDHPDLLRSQNLIGSTSSKISFDSFEFALHRIESA